MQAWQRITYILIGGALFFYFGTALVFAHNDRLVSDDFLNAGLLCELVYGRPYVDFTPWNNLPGHYLQLPAFLIDPHPVLGMINIRIELALINTLCLAGAVVVLLRRFRPEVVLLGLLGLVFVYRFASLSIPVRLDMLSTWAGFFAFLAATGGRWTGAGLLAGLSFILSHKGVYHIASLEAGLFGLLLLCPDRRVTVKNILRFSLAAALFAGLYYLCVFVVFAPPGVIGSQMNGKLHALANLPLISGLRLHSMEQIFGRNWFFTLSALAGLLLCLLSLVRPQPPLIMANPAPYFPNRAARITTAGYLLGLIACCLIHTHPYGYFFVIIFPALWYASHFFWQWLLAQYDQRPPEKRINFLCITSAFVLLGFTLWIPRQYWTPDFILTMGFVCPAVIFAVALPLYYLCRRLSPRYPQVVRALLLALLATGIAAANLRPLYANLSAPVSHHPHFADQYLIPRLKMLQKWQDARAANKPFVDDNGFPRSGEAAKHTPEDTPIQESTVK